MGPACWGALLKACAGLRRLPTWRTEDIPDGRADLAMATQSLTLPPAISPLAPASFPAMPPVPGVRLATAAAGIRYAGRPDVLLALFDRGTAVAGVFTRS